MRDLNFSGLSEGLQLFKIDFLCELAVDKCDGLEESAVSSKEMHLFFFFFFNLFIFFSVFPYSVFRKS